MNVAIILAGGVGSRVGADRPKQFIEIFGKPVIVYTVEAFQNHPEIDAVEIVCVKSHIEYMNELKQTYGLNKIKWITEGGKTFQESVMNGVNNLKDKIGADDIVLVHFGASPLVTDSVITDAIKVCKEKGNAISTIPIYVLSGWKDDEEKSTTWIDRDKVACMSSPHAFRYAFIKELYEKAVSTGVINEVEPHTTTLMYKMGEPIYFSKGSQINNIKITEKEDLDFLKAFILLKQYKNKFGEN